MPKNTTGGNKHKKQAKGAFAERAKFLAADPDSQHYGICTSVLGNSRFEIIVYEKEKKNKVKKNLLFVVTEILHINMFEFIAESGAFTEKMARYFFS